jgi:hypothetical protein
MNNYLINRLTLCFIFLTSYLIHSQEYIETTIFEKKVKEYFSDEREHIHLHLNKSVYLTNEDIWFKGYIINNKVPFLYTTNVHLKIYDNFNNLIDNKLIFASNGFFGGKFDLSSKYKTGIYKIHVFTYYMNNFIEDDSSVYEIKIVNPTDEEEVVKVSNLNDVRVNFFPESGVFLNDFSNTFGVKIKDCNNNGIEIKNAEIINAQNEIISTFNTNKHGVGKFEILDAKNEIYKLKYIIEGTEKTEPLPNPTNGINFSINSYSIEDKIVLKIRKNEDKERTLKVLIFQDYESSFFTVSIPKAKKELLIDVEKDLFFNGINNVILFDEDDVKIGDRLLFVSKIKKNDYENDLIVAQKRNDSIVFLGKSPLQKGNVSISVLPFDSATSKINTSITTKYYLDNYLEFPSYLSYEDLNSRKRGMLYEIDKMLLSSKPKYKWENILTNSKDKTHEFERGVSIKGTINTLDKNKGNLIVNMKAIGLGINNNAYINEKNEFEFKNVIAVDSTKLYFTVIDNTRKKLDHKIYTSLVNNSRNFIKPLFLNSGCELISKKTIIEKQEYPKIEGSILLDSVSIIAKKNKLKNENQKGNFYARGFKITDEINNSNRDLLDFLNKNGFDVRKQRGNITINDYNYAAALTNELPKTNNRGGRGRRFGPAVFIDNIQILDYNSLEGLDLSAIDEIYLDKNRNDLTMANWVGFIKIYTKKNNFTLSTNPKSESIFVKNGFQNYSPFTLPKYVSFTNNAFKRFGVINWIPSVETNENGSYRFSIPNMYQKSIRILIEGVSENGELYSDVREITIE